MYVAWTMPSTLYPSHLYRTRLTDEVLDVALGAIQEARKIDLVPLSESRTDGTPDWIWNWPGDHYRLLAGLVRTIKPEVVVEVGTYTGKGALVMSKEMHPDGTVLTADYYPWNATLDGLPTVLRDEDFTDGRLKFVQGDCRETKMWEPHRALIERASMVLLDGDKSVGDNRAYLDALVKSGLKDSAWLVVDDIRFAGMDEFWLSLRGPKLDLTSFGHWSGTGLARLR